MGRGWNHCRLTSPMQPRSRRDLQLYMHWSVTPRLRVMPGCHQSCQMADTLTLTSWVMLLTLRTSAQTAPTIVSAATAAMMMSTMMIAMGALTSTILMTILGTLHVTAFPRTIPAWLGMNVRSIRLAQPAMGIPSTDRRRDGTFVCVYSPKHHAYKYIY